MDLLLEIGTEELPAGFVEPALSFLYKSLPAALDDARLEHGDVRVDGTPRRLVCVVQGVAERQPDKTEEVTGPKASVAWGEDGALSKAGAGFLRGKGLDEKDAYRKETKKGEVMAVKVHEPGRAAAEVVPALLEDLISRVPFKKTMRWTDDKHSFGRPLRWLLALLGDQPLELRWGDVRSGGVTHGHRFHAPDAVEVRSVADHEQALADGRVVLSRQRRKEMIIERARALAEEVGGELLEDAELLDEVTNLVEYPWPVLGRFDDKFLQMPRELLLSEMKEHQRYFGVAGKDGELINAFVLVAGSEPPDAAKLAAGNTRVLRSRFEDGAFYFEEDAKHRLEDQGSELARVVFQRDLGTIADKVERVTKLVAMIADAAKVPADEKERALRAAALCKADLVSGVVGEFPELQGTMGRYYALRDGEHPRVAHAIEQHYWPRGAGHGVPVNDEGALVALADRLDTLVGILGVGKAPKGSADPFGLRRAAIAIARILLDRGWRVSLRDLVDFALIALTGRLKKGEDELATDAIAFCEARLVGVLRDRCEEEGLEGARDLVDAALGAGSYDMVDAEARCLALARLRQEDVGRFEQLAATFKRVGNILAKARGEGLAPSADRLSDDKLVEGAEKALFAEVSKARESFAARGEGDGDLALRYQRSLDTIVALKPHVDTFFDDVMVMTDDEALRDARLDLLAGAEEMLVTVADFTKVQVES
jgi:glycyl-tRNA synthetase beta chain